MPGSTGEERQTHRQGKGRKTSINRNVQRVEAEIPWQNQLNEHIDISLRDEMVRICILIETTKWNYRKGTRIILDLNILWNWKLETIKL